MSDGRAHVELRAVGKRFGGIQALTDVNLTIDRGTIHGLVGENGAGKSTLGKIIAGVHRPDTGELWVDGKCAEYSSPRQALADGLTIIAQELALVPQLTVTDNVFLGGAKRGRFLISDREMRLRYANLQEEAGFAVPPDARVGLLRVADQQKVEILKALARDAKMIVMDEPSAALTPDETQRLFEVIRSLRTRGTTIVFVSHFLKEVLSIVDTVTVLRDGRLIRTSPAAQETPESLVTGMLGRSIDMTFPPRVLAGKDAPIVCAVRGLSRANAIQNVSFEVRAGEIVGLAGLIGSGRTEVARAIFGADRRDSGEITIDGNPVEIRSPRDAIDAGIAMLPENRKEQGLLMRRSITSNITLPHLRDVSTLGVVSNLRERAATKRLSEQVDIRTSNLADKVQTLSGGNQQKVLFAKWLLGHPRLLIADEPTRGIDVGAKHAIYELIRSLAEEGVAVLLISSELEEVLGLAHRVLVMREGRMVAELDATTMSPEAIMRAAFATDLLVAEPAIP